MNKKKIFIGIGTILILIILVCLLVVLKNRNIKMHERKENRMKNKTTKKDDIKKENKTKVFI